MERSGIVEWMTPQLSDPRRQEDIVHDLASLIWTTALTAQGGRDPDDADALRDDPVLRLAVSSASGRTPFDLHDPLAHRATRRKAYWQTFDERTRLSNRDLADMGIHLYVIDDPICDFVGLPK